MWCNSNDKTAPVITAKAHVDSMHGSNASFLQLPETAVVFFAGHGVNYLRERYNARELPEKFPRFIGSCPIYTIDEFDLCILDGGRGAPQACDTVETLAALGVRNIVAVGLFGAYDSRIQVGEIVTPERVFVEEGTSLHYYEAIEYAEPDAALLEMTAEMLGTRRYPLVTTDAVYRQTFYKEELWRQKGAVGVDMETSAVFSVSRYLGVRAVGLLMASDIHPLTSESPKWAWHMTREMRISLAEKGLAAARAIK